MKIVKKSKLSNNGLQLKANFKSNNKKNFKINCSIQDILLALKYLKKNKDLIQHKN